MAPFFHALVPRPGTGEIPACHHLQLPKVHYDGDTRTSLWKLCRKTERLLSDRFELFLLRAECEAFDEAETNYDQEYDATLLIFEVVSTENMEAPPGFCWVEKERASRITLDLHVFCISQFLHNYAEHGLSEVNYRMYPYSVPGWYTDATTWTRKECVRHRLHISQILQATRKAEGCVLKALTDEGQCLYFKEVGPLAPLDEVRVTEVLADSMPHIFPQLLSVDRERKWMLLHDQGPVFGDKNAFSVSKNPDRFRCILTEWGKIQRRSVSQVSELKRKGLNIVDCVHLKEEVMKMATDAEWFSLCSEEMRKMDSGKSMDFQFFKDALINCVSYLEAQISQHRVPLSIVHGDLDPGNIILSEKREVKVIDLGSTCLSYPFRDAIAFSEICGADEKDLEFYFDMWSEYGTVEDLRKLYRAVVGLEYIFNCVAVYRWYTAVEPSRVSSRRKAANGFALVMMQLHALQPGH